MFTQMNELMNERADIWVDEWNVPLGGRQMEE